MDKLRIILCGLAVIVSYWLGYGMGASRQYWKDHVDEADEEDEFTNRDDIDMFTM